MPREEYRPTTVGELKAALADLDLPDDTPLVANEINGHPNGRYTGYVILASRGVVEEHSGDHRRFRRAESGDLVAAIKTALYVVG